MNKRIELTCFGVEV